MSTQSSPDQSASPEPHSSTNPASDARLNRIEEAIGYTERTTEHLSTEIASLNQRIQSLTKRLAALEAQLTKLQSPEEDNP